MASQIPKDLLVKIFSLLDIPDLVLLSVCKHWYHTFAQSDLWRIFQQRYQTHLFVQDENVADEVKFWYLKFYDVLDCYERLVPIFLKLREIQPLNPGVDRVVIDEFEAEKGIVMPEGLKCLYLMADGEQQESGLFGSYSFYDHLVENHFNSFARARSFEKMLLSTDGVLFLFAFSNSPVIHGCLLKTGKIYRNGRGLAFEICSSMEEFLEEYVGNVETGMYARRENIDLFPMNNLPVATTNGVKIEVSVLFVPERSNEEDSFWTYRVMMSMDENSSARQCTLTTRHWEITDHEGQVEVVDGPGVIGYYPTMKPGAYFEYESCCSLTNAGTMGGWFTMIYENGDSFNAIVPTFHLQLPNYSTTNWPTILS